MPVVRRLLVFVVAAAVSAVALGGCTSDPNSLANQAKAGDGKGYVSGDGTVEQIPKPQRKAPIELAGTTVTGEQWSRSKDAADKVVVVNKWASWCGPCVAEADTLQQVWKIYDTKDSDVVFIGIDVRESPETGAAFLRTRKISYPSLTDPDGIVELSLQGKAAATPTTLVLDKSGRIAARIAGATDKATLTGVIDDVVAGEAN